MRNKRGQMMLIGILILVMALLIFISTLPAIQEVTNGVKGCSYLNCNGYVDTENIPTVGATCSSTNQTQTSTFDSNTLACTVIDLTIPFLILAVLAGLVMRLISGRMVERQEEYGGY